MVVEDVVQSIEPTRQFSDEEIWDSLQTAVGVYMAECVDPVIRTGMLFQDHAQKFVQLPQKVLMALPDSISPQVVNQLYDEGGLLFEMFWSHLDILHRTGQTARIMQRIAEAKQ